MAQSIKRKDTHEMLVPRSGRHCPGMQNRFAPTAFLLGTLTRSLGHFIGTMKTHQHFRYTIAGVP